MMKSEKEMIIDLADKAYNQSVAYRKKVLERFEEKLKKQKGDYWEVDAKEKIQNAQRRIKEVINMEWSKGMEYILSEVKEIFEEELKKEKGDGE